jgi:hypothetical protein
MGYYEDFVYGFLTNPSGPDTFGRPVGLLVLKDGSLLFTEDGNNRIYLVQYGQNITNTIITSSTINAKAAVTTFSSSFLLPLICILLFIVVHS